MKFNSFPPNPLFTNDGEKIVYGHLVEQLPSGVDVFCNLEWIDQQDRREIDFIVAIPDKGLVILEVKGGKVETRGNSWRQFDRRTNEWHSLPIVHQLSREQSILKDALKPIFGRSCPKIAKLLVTPETMFSFHATLPGMNRNMLVAKNQMSELFQLMCAALDEKAHAELFTNVHQELVRNLLAEREPDYANLVSTSRHRGALVDDLSREQFFILELLTDNSKIYVSGGPGTGKSVLALEDAINLVRSELRVGVVCFNRGLAESLKRAVKDLGEESQPVFCGNILDDLPSYWKLQVPEEPTDVQRKAHHFGTVVPGLLLKSANQLSHYEKLDAWVVDEAQDFDEEHWAVLRASLKDPVDGIIHMFGDTNQNLFRSAIPEVSGFKINTPWHYAIVRLKHNFRSSQQIANVLNSFYSIDEEPTGLVQGVIPQILVVDDGQDVIVESEKLVSELIKDFNWNPGDIAVVTTKRLHPKQKVQREADYEAYWNKYFDKQEVFYTNINSFKGLERPMVVVAVDGIPNEADAKRQIFVAASRARDDLVIVGKQNDLDHLGHLIGQFETYEFEPN